MKVVCIDNNDGNSKHLDLFGVYDVDPEESAFPDHYIIRKPNQHKYNNINNKIFTGFGGQIHKSFWVKKEKFITLDEWRKIKLDQII